MPGTRNLQILLEQVIADVRRLRRTMTRMMLSHSVGLVQRYDLAARLLHWSHLCAFTGLVYTGLAAYFPVLMVPLGGAAGSLRIHRLLGISLAASALLFLAVFPQRSIRFLAELAQWRLTDLVWLVKFPLYLLVPSRVTLPEAKGKLNPGQRIVSGSLVFLSGLLVVTGITRWPIPLLPAGLVDRAEALHRITTPLIFLFFAGHAFIGSGIHPVYRGAWRAMIGNGFIPVRLAREHWPQWLYEKAVGRRYPGKQPAAGLRGLLVGFIMFTTMTVLFILIPAIPLPDSRNLPPRTDGLQEGVFEVRTANKEYKLWIKPRSVVQLQVKTGPDTTVTAGEAKEALILGALIERRYAPPQRGQR